MLEQGTRRGFVTGLGALFLAPAIVRPTSIMPVKFVDIYNTRCLIDYHIGTDSLILRIDRALHELKIPKYITHITDLSKVYKIISKEKILSLKPDEGIQQNIMVHVTKKELDMLGISKL